MASTGKTDPGSPPRGFRLAHPIQLTDLARTGRLNADGRSEQAYRCPRVIATLDSMVVGGRSSAVPLWSVGRSVQGEHGGSTRERRHPAAASGTRSDVTSAFQWDGWELCKLRLNIAVAQFLHQGTMVRGGWCKIRDAAKAIA